MKKSIAACSIILSIILAGCVSEEQYIVATAEFPKVSYNDSKIPSDAVMADLTIYGTEEGCHRWLRYQTVATVNVGGLYDRTEFGESMECDVYIPGIVIEQVPAAFQFRLSVVNWGTGYNQYSDEHRFVIDENYTIYEVDCPDCLFDNTSILDHVTLELY